MSVEVEARVMGNFFRLLDAPYLQNLKPTPSRPVRKADLSSCESKLQAKINLWYFAQICLDLSF